MTTGSAPSGATGDAARWQLVESLLHESLAREPGARGRYLDAACPDADARREVEALIAAHLRTGPLDRLADAVMAPLHARGPRRPSPAGLPALERYTLAERLGGGGMGVVYRARDERLQRDVALKFLPPHLSGDEAAKKRFVVEARAAASLEHPNVCTVHEIGETGDGQLYIVMACYDGETLDKRIARGPLPVAAALGIAADVARGLAKAHDRGIVHRDVKPANIMLTADGVVKVLDFGVAKLAGPAATHTGGGVGTIAYMSPEQAFGDPVDRRADVWALAVVLYEMLAGARPFRGPAEQAVLYAILEQEPEPLARVRGDVPPEVDALLRRALAKRPADRFADAAELLAGIAALPPAPADAPAPAPRAADSDATDSVLTRAGERRQAAVVVTGVAGYDHLVERLGADEIEALAARVRDAAAAVAAHHGGIVNHFAGDDAVLLFGVVAAHEDDFLRSVRAALDLHARVRALGADVEQRFGVPVRLRTGVHAGALVAQRQRAGDRRFRVTGAPLDVAARLAALAEPDAILVSPECHRVVAPFVEATPAAPVALRADAAPVTPWRVVAESRVPSRLQAAERAGLTPYAGRSRELAVLEELLDAAAGGAGAVAVVVGEAGAGKSRLLHELVRRVAASGACLALGRCDAYGGTTPYLPLVQALRELLGIDPAAPPGAAHDRVVERVRALEPSLGDYLPLYLALLSVPSAEHPVPRHLHGEHLQAAMLDALAALVTLHARRATTVLLLEDWHWADEASRVALAQLAQHAPAHRLLVVVTCRPEAGVDWSGVEHLMVPLGPLDPAASAKIVRAVLCAERVAPELAHQLHERTGGNPFFLEETCQALREEGAVAVRDGEAVAAASGAVHLPGTVQAVIRARLDRLDPAARDLARVASVLGREFPRAVLEAVAPVGPAVAGALDRLRAAGLVQQTSVAPEPAYRFKHVLTQEVAYDTLLEHQRRALHAAAGRAIETRYADRLDEHLERLAHHFGRAEEWRTAVRYGLRAADRAKALSQFADALATLDAVQEWLPRLPAGAERDDLLADVLLRQERLCETLGLRARQLAIAERLIALLAPRGGSARLAEAYLRQGDVCTLLRRFDAADRALGTSLRLSRELGDRAAERNALRSLGLLRSHEGRPAEAIASIEEALALDEALGETAAVAGDVASLGSVLRTVGRHGEALEALERALAYLDEHHDPTKRCAVMSVIGAVYRDRGEPELALHWLRRASEEAIEHHIPILASFSLPAVAHLLFTQGRTEESLATYRQAAALSRRARHADGLAQSLRALGEVLVGLGRFSEALPTLAEAVVLFEQLEDSEAQRLLWARLATARERTGDPVGARAAWAAARALCADGGAPNGELDALEGIARSTRAHAGGAAALPRYEDALRRAVELGQHRREASFRNTLGIVRWELGEHAAALAEFEAALRLCRESEDRVHEGLLLNSLGATLLRMRRWDEARTALEEGARVNAATGERLLEAHSHATLAQVFLATERPAEARPRVEAALAIRRELGDRRGEGWMLEHLARALGSDGRAAEADEARAAARAIARDLPDAALLAALDSAPLPAHHDAGGDARPPSHGR
ncbi:MAG: protein kinase domain-containing protein [Gemmatimonadaceae bacterium]